MVLEVHLVIPLLFQQLLQQVVEAVKVVKMELEQVVLEVVEQD
jgi:hypothetical protein